MSRHLREAIANHAEVQARIKKHAEQVAEEHRAPLETGPAKMEAEPAELPPLPTPATTENPDGGVAV